MMRPSDYTEGWETPGIDPAHALCVLERDAPYLDWLACRRTGLGGSDVSAILALSSYNSPLDVWVDKIDPDRPDRNDDAELGPMFWGRTLEPVVRGVFEQHTGLDVALPGTLRSVSWPWMICNLDGLVNDGALLEIKTSRDFAASQWEDGQVADHAELQAQHNMAVTGAQACWVVCLIGGSNMVIRKVERDDSMIKDLVAEERRFWNEYVLANEMPPAEPGDAYTDALSERFRLAVEGTRTIEADTRTKIKAMLAQADAAETYAEVGDQAKNWMRQLMGEQTALAAVVDGKSRELATWAQNGKLGTKQLQKDHPEVWEEYQTKIESFDLDRFKKDRPDLYTQYRGRVLRIKDKD